ncbi:Double-stranded RNA-binding protein [Ancistrocladus abbreviatus]
MYKNQLQELAQRSCFNLPSYACFREGPDHAPRFRASVNFNGEIFESPGYSSTLRQAEHAAAEAALNALSNRGSRSLTARVLDETGVYKNLLQETAHKAGLNLPVYTTVRSGPGHVPVFSCTVELAGLEFTGEPAKTKKQAEKNAAIAAWSALKKMPSLVLKKEEESHEEQDQEIVKRVLSNLRPRGGGRQVKGGGDQWQSRRRMVRAVKYQQQQPWRPLDYLVINSASSDNQSQEQKSSSSFVDLLPPPPPRTTSKILPLTSSPSPSSSSSSYKRNRPNSTSIQYHPNREEDRDRVEGTKKPIGIEGATTIRSSIYKPFPRASRSTTTTSSNSTQQEEAYFTNWLSGHFPPSTVSTPSSIDASFRSEAQLRNMAVYSAPAVQIRTVIPVCSAAPTASSNSTLPPPSSSAVGPPPSTITTTVSTSTSMSQKPRGKGLQRQPSSKVTLTGEPYSSKLCSELNRLQL